MNNSNYKCRLFVKQYLKVVQRRKELGLPYDEKYLVMIKQMAMMKSNPEIFTANEINQNLKIRL